MNCRLFSRLFTWKKLVIRCWKQHSHGETVSNGSTIRNVLCFWRNRPKDELNMVCFWVCDLFIRIWVSMTHGHSWNNYRQICTLQLQLRVWGTEAISLSFPYSSLKVRVSFRFALATSLICQHLKVLACFVDVNLAKHGVSALEDRSFSFSCVVALVCQFVMRQLIIHMRKIVRERVLWPETYCYFPQSVTTVGKANLRSVVWD